MLFATGSESSKLLRGCTQSLPLAALCEKTSQAAHMWGSVSVCWSTCSLTYEFMMLFLSRLERPAACPGHETELKLCVDVQSWVLPTQCHAARGSNEQPRIAPMHQAALPPGLPATCPGQLRAPHFWHPADTCLALLCSLVLLMKRAAEVNSCYMICRVPASSLWSSMQAPVAAA